MENNNEKTVFLSSTENSDTHDSEKTTINNNTKTAENSDEATQIQSSENKQDEGSQSNLKKVVNKSPEGISGGTFAAGVAGAAVAGTALGATYSEQIKNVLNGDGYGAPDSPEADLNSVKPDNLVEAPSNAQFASFGNNTENQNLHGSSTFEMSKTDYQGNVYNVTMSDFDGDGKFDLATEEIQLVNGTSISYTATGDQINSTFLDDFNSISMEQPQRTHQTNQGSSGLGNGHGTNELAITGTDAEGNYVNITITDFNGDGIADIANESITTPNGTTVSLTQTGNQIDTSFYNTSSFASSEDYQNLSISDTNGAGASVVFEDMGEPSSYQPSMVEYSEFSTEEATPQEIETGQNYENIDWAAFNEAPSEIETNQYGEHLSDTNFDEYQTPESYEENNFYENENDLTDGGFM